MFQPVHLEHRGARVLRLDYTDLTPQELIAAFERSAAEIATAPPASLRILTVLATHFDEASAQALKRHAPRNGPHIKACAVVTRSAFWRVMVTGLQVRGREDLRLFDDEPAALDWLAEQ